MFVSSLRASTSPRSPCSPVALQTSVTQFITKMKLTPTDTQQQPFTTQRGALKLSKTQEPEVAHHLSMVTVGGSPSTIPVYDIKNVYSGLSESDNSKDQLYMFVDVGDWRSALGWRKPRSKQR
jgi:hypothetical protein